MLEYLKKLDNCPKLPRFELYRFRPVIELPQVLPVFDFTEAYDPNRCLETRFGIGRYDEIRPTMYTETQFIGNATTEPRNIHMGIDIAAPEGTPVFSFCEGAVLFLGNNSLAQDYGPVCVTEHTIDGQKVYALYGHLSMATLDHLCVGQKLCAGECIGWLGNRAENGGWNPHLHFQLSLLKPQTHDLPGVVGLADREWARRVFPDPRLVLGPLY